MGIMVRQHQTEEAARQYLEAKLWPDGPVCPHCGVIGEATLLRPYSDTETHARKGTYQCNACRKQFTVTVGTIFEDSKIPLHKWMLAIHLMCSSKKGISALQLQRELWGEDAEKKDKHGRPRLKGSYRTAWFMCHRVRWAMTQSPMAEALKKMSGTVETDETYVGGREKGKRGMPGPDSKKTPVLALLERGGNVHSFPLERATLKNIKPIIHEHVDPRSHLVTDKKAAMSAEGAPAFNGERLQVAREFRGITQSKLADAVAASDTLISFCESGKKSDPAPDLVQACAEVLGFQTSFFYGPILDSFRAAQCSFRHRKTAALRLKEQTRAHGTLIGLVVQELRTVLQFPPLNLPHVAVETEDDVERAAEYARRFWGIDSDGPINQVGRLLENAGVIIISHVVGSNKIDAFSRCGPTAVIFLNRQIQSSSRWHFDIAHECGHLVMHGGICTGSTESETQADRFGSALLMPRRAFSRDFRTGRFSWDHVFQLKKRWKVSASAIIHRAFDLALIDAVSYRQAYKYMSFKGWTKGEPFEPTFTEPELLRSAFSALGSKVGLDLRGLCDRLGFTPETFQDVTGTPIPPSSPKMSVVEFPAKAG